MTSQKEQFYIQRIAELEKQVAQLIKINAELADTLIFVSLGIFVVLAIIFWIIIRRHRVGCGILLLIV